MADRYFNQDGENAQPGVVTIDMIIILGSAGAVPATPGTTDYSYGIKSVSSSGSGVYVVTFQDGYTAYLNGFGNVLQASYAAGGACVIKPSAIAVASATPTVTLTTYTAAGAAVQPATGDQIAFSFRLKRIRGDGTL